ncbi:MAG: peroxiredoxin family protein [Muribaculaceae bacterium]|nr:peroxiredoxin family protein [Muribaculaceae bacterium]
MSKVFLTAVGAGLLMLAACSEPGFKVSGEIEGGSGEPLLLEKSDFHGRWIPIDSTRLSDSGKFTFRAPAPASPEIYRLVLDDRYIYFPIDSVESVSVTSDIRNFGSDFTLAGSDNARNLAAFEQDLHDLQDPDSVAKANFKRDVYTKYIKDSRGSIVAYYILTKYFDGKPLYDAKDPADTKYFAAVATQFEQFRPDDPHGKMVRQVSLDALRNRNNITGKRRVVEAKEISMLDISLPDETGRTRSLSEVVGKGKPVLLVFSLMNEQESPAFNRSIDMLRRRGAEVFQVSFDQGQYEWREAAANLPWITVIDPNGTSSTALVDYNVSTLPAIFVYDAQGNLVDRPATVNDVKF